MPKVLIVAATYHEIEPLLREFGIELTGNNGLFGLNGNSDIAFLITGVGMVSTAYFMGKHDLSNYNYIINAGIAGAFVKELRIGEVVNVTRDTISEMGAEDGNDFIKYADLGLQGTNIFSNDNRIDSLPLQKLKKVNAVTVNTVHGNEISIKKVIDRYQPDVESMEGAAFFMACSDSSAKYLQLRAVSNYVEKRDKSKWDIPLAIKNLNNVVLEIIQSLR